MFPSFRLRWHCVPHIPIHTTYKILLSTSLLLPVGCPPLKRPPDGGMYQKWALYLKLFPFPPRPWCDHWSPCSSLCPVTLPEIWASWLPWRHLQRSLLLVAGPIADPRKEKRVPIQLHSIVWVRPYPISDPAAIIRRELHIFYGWHLNWEGKGKQYPLSPSSPLVTFVGMPSNAVSCSMNIGMTLPIFTEEAGLVPDAESGRAL